MEARESGCEDVPPGSKASGNGRRLNALPLVVARMVAGVATLAIPLVLTRTLSLIHFATYKQVFLVLQTLGLVLPFGFAQSLYFFVPRERARSRAFLVQTTVVLGIIGAAAGGATWVLGPAIAGAMHNPGLADHRLALALLLALMVGSFPLEIGLTTHGRLRAASVCYLATDLLRAAVLIVPAVRGWGLSAMLGGVALLYGLRTVVAWMQAAGAEGPSWSREGFREQVKYALPFGAAMLLSVPQQSAHLFAVSAWLGPAAFAIYSIGCFQIPLIEMLYTPVCELLMIRAGRSEQAGVPFAGLMEFRKAAIRLGYAFLPVALFCATEPGRVVEAAFGPRFAPAAAVFRLTALGFLLQAIPIEALLRARAETRYILRCAALKALWTLPLLYLGFRWGGVVGVAGAQLLSELGSKLVLLRRLSTLPAWKGARALTQALPWRAWGAALAAGGVATLVTRWSDGSIDLLMMPTAGLVARLGGLVVSGLVFTATYALVVRLSGVRLLELALSKVETASP